MFAVWLAVTAACGVVTVALYARDLSKPQADFSLAAAALHELGLHRATDVIGGFRAWTAAGLPSAPASAGTATLAPGATPALPRHRF